MDLTPENKAYIDSLTYDELFHRVRFALAGNIWFQGPTGEYWLDRMNELEANGVDRVAASKRVGWEK